MLNKFMFLINSKSIEEKSKKMANRKKLNRKLDSKDITIEQLEKLIKQGAILIDVRSPQEFDEGHLENAICVPDYEITNKIEQMVKNKQDPIILYCSSGYRSGKAQKKLEKMGYNMVYNLKL